MSNRLQDPNKGSGSAARNLGPDEESKQDLSLSYTGQATQPMCISEAEKSKIISDPAFEKDMRYIIFWYEKRKRESIVNLIKDKE